MGKKMFLFFYWKGQFLSFCLTSFFHDSPHALDLCVHMGVATECTRVLLPLDDV